MKSNPMRWRKVRVPCHGYHWELWRDGKQMATVAYEGMGWYWYGDGHNSLWGEGTYSTEAKAKTAAAKYLKARTVCMSEHVEFLRKCASAYDPSETQQGLRSAADRLEELEAIVAKLPKTEDGVPIFPGMKVYDQLGYRVTHEGVVKGFTVGRNGQLLCLYFGDNGFDAICSGYYSTREAAEKAKEER